MTSIGSKATAVAVAVILAGAGVAACSASGEDGANGQPQQASEQQASPRSAPPRVYHMETLDAFDTSDERMLVGFADNVFVGRVGGRVGDEPLEGRVVPDPDSPEGAAPSTPQTQFSVEVLDNVKGQLNRTVTVSQTGGRVPGENAVMQNNGDPLLQPGQTVLFATRFDSGRGWHQITSANHADVRLETSEERNRVVNRFEEARENQIDPTPGRH